MKATGIVRKVDELGRLVLPVELRRDMEIGDRAPMEIYREGDQIVLRKYRSSCVFCGETDELGEYKGKAVCKYCRAGLAGKEGD